MLNPACSTRKLTALSAVLGLAALLALGLRLPSLAQDAATPSATSAFREGDDVLPKGKQTIASAVRVDLSKNAATLPLHKGTFQGKPAWYVITDASDKGIADQLGINFAPKLANITTGCPGCVQQVTSAGKILGGDPVEFQGVPDFSPSRVLVPGPDGFPPLAVRPGGVADLHYSPFVQLKGSTVVYDAPIVAVGDGPFDVVHHQDTQDRVLAIDPDKMTVDLLFIRGFTNGQPILYLSFESSDALTATIERSTFAPGLGLSPFPGGSTDPKSARAEIFTFTNAKTGAASPPAQGLTHVLVDGHNAEDVNLENTAAIEALVKGGDAHNVQESSPTFQGDLAKNYSPLWDLQIGVWSDAAVARGLNTAQTDAEQIRQLALQGLVTAPGGLPLAPAGIIINCPVLGFTDQAPTGAILGTSATAATAAAPSGTEVASPGA